MVEAGVASGTMVHGRMAIGELTITISFSGHWAEMSLVRSSSSRKATKERRSSISSMTMG
jgi:hypothetical protein